MLLSTQVSKTLWTNRPPIVPRNIFPYHNSLPAVSCYLYCCRKKVKMTNESTFCPHTGIIRAACSNTPNPNPNMINNVLNPPYNVDNDLWNDIHEIRIRKMDACVAVRKFSYSTCFFFLLPWYNSMYALTAIRAMELAKPILNHSCFISGLWIMLWNKLISRGCVWCCCEESSADDCEKWKTRESK